MLLPGNDTLEEEGRTVVLEKPIPTATPYEMLQEKLAATLYEFERLMYSVEFAKTHSISTEQVAEIFGQLKYDNTRIQFLKDVRKKIKDPENLNQLKEEVEYEITKQQLQKMIDAK